MEVMGLYLFFFSTRENQEDLIRNQSVSTVETGLNDGRCALCLPKRPCRQTCREVWEWAAVTRAPGYAAEKVKLALCIPTCLFLPESTFHPSYWTRAIEFPCAAICLLNLSPPCLFCCSAQRFVLFPSHSATVPIPRFLRWPKWLKTLTFKFQWGLKSISSLKKLFGVLPGLLGP